MTEDPESSPPATLGQPPRTGRFWFDFIAAMAAMMISVISLVVAIRGERTQRGLLAANSWPFIQLSEDQGGTEDRLDVENAGVGPAKILTFELYYKGKRVNDPSDLLQRCCGLPRPAPGASRPSIAGLAAGQVYDNVLRPGEHILALRIRRTPATEMLFDQFTAAMSSLRFKACYCSVLGECWESDLRSLAQSRVQACRGAEHSFFVRV